MDVSVRYDEASAKYAGQFVIARSNDDVVVSFSSGVLSDAQSGQAVLPVHSRIALSHSGARRLSQLLLKALEADSRASTSGNASAEVGSPGEASSV